MTNQDKINASDILNNVVIEGMQKIKGNDIISLNLKDIETAVCDYFIICHGTSNTHVNAIADSVIEETLKTLQDKPFSKEGMQSGEWILLDYGNVVVHVFQKEIRDFYNIEKLWGDAVINHIKQ
ncbi:ribosome silencing factor [Flavobacteriales bacterium]|nr:ribosome silencing factor [Flavobacteriales bacterium]